MNEWLSRFLLVLLDVFSITFSLALAFGIREWSSPFFTLASPSDISPYIGFEVVYAVTLILLAVEGIYTKRYDFWQELERIAKALLLSAVIVLAVLAMTQQTELYSRFILMSTFALLFLFLPFQKYFLKQFLFKTGLWVEKASIIGNDPFFEEHVFTNPYLGYIRTENQQAQTLFISSSKTIDELEEILHLALIRRQKIIFIPLIKNFDFSDADIIHLFNARSNLIVVENNLINRINQLLKATLDYMLALLLLPIVLFTIFIITLFIWSEEPGKSVFFTQKRLGRNGQEFSCYKFRSMRENGEHVLKEYLKSHPEEIRNYEIYHKYESDPRITKIGTILRKTSLDELPQIINVLKGEMSLIGPRPYMMNERSKMGPKGNIILTVKPGITGLWQVSGRSEVDFMSRVDLDVWYVRNWSIWKDIIILFKTIQVVLGRKGAS